MNRILVVGVAGFLVSIAASALGAQERGAISGQVVDRADLRPLAGAQVIVAGTNLATLTNQQGRYLIANVPPGPREVRVSLIGYARGTVAVDVVVGEVTTADLELSGTVLELEGVIATATGQELRRRELGNAVATISVPDVALAPVTSFTQLLQGRVPGATIMQSSGATGAGARIRIRGNNSVSLSNSPLLIVDGVRVMSGENVTLAVGVGGQAMSTLNDLNPANIESIEILKGPAAAALYGTAAANGVIQVTTRRGRAGTPEFRAWSEYGTSAEVTAFPTNYYAMGQLLGGPGVGDVVPGSIGRCDNIRQAIGAGPGPNQVGCTLVTEVHSFNPLEDAATRPFQTGNRRVAGASLSGGGEAATFYVSSEFENEVGVLPQNEQSRIFVQGNMSGAVGSNLRIGTTLGFVETDLEMSLSDNALFGILGMALYGDPRPQFVESQQGFRSDPRFFYDWISTGTISRLTGSGNADWRPLTWIALNATVGLDRRTSQEVNRLPRNTVYSIFGPPYTGGFIQNFNTHATNFNGNAGASSVFHLRQDLVSTVSVGTQYIREDFNEVYSFGSQLTPGIEKSLAGATSDFAADEANVRNSTISAYLQEQLAWRDRVFVTGAIRGDQNTAFGTNIGWIWYPAFSASWVISEEPFFQNIPYVSNYLRWLNNLRLRGALGQSGLRPGSTAALQSFGSSISVFQSLDQPAIVIGSTGNPGLRPERATEWEVGFEMGLLEERVGLEATYFHKMSRDALVTRPLPPSLGGSSARLENLGRVRNAGFEGLISVQPLRLPMLAWNVTLSGSRIRNELVDLGVDLQGNPIEPIIFGLASDTQRHAEGYALGSWFQRPITFEDADGNGRLTPAEVTVADSSQFLGNPFPTREVSLSSDLTLFRWIRLSGLFDYKGGHQIMNFTRGSRCLEYVCADAYGDEVPLQRQAAIIGLNVYDSWAGFIENADFWRLREVALTFRLPARYATRLRSNDLSLTFAGRNLATWTVYTGFDPEVNFAGQANFTSGDAATLPPNRQLMIRVDANF